MIKELNELHTTGLFPSEFFMQDLKKTSKLLKIYVFKK